MSFLRLLGLVGLSAFFVGCGDDESLFDSGSTLWGRRFGRGSSVEPVGLAGVESGGVIVAGRYHGEVDLGGGALPSPGNNYQAYVARYDGEGRHVYSRSFGAEFAEMSNDVATSPDGTALVAGTFGWEMELDGVVLPWTGSDDAFVAKLDPAGKVVWARALGGAGRQRGFAVAAMPDGGAIVAGTTSGALDLGVGEPQTDSKGAFLVRLDASGAPVWSRLLSSSDGFTVVNDVAARGDTIAVVGRFAFELDLGLDVDLVAGGYNDGFVVTYDLDGAPLWSRKVGEAGYNDVVSAVAFAPDGGLVLTGKVEGGVDLGGGFHQAADEYDANTFLLELDAAGNHRRSNVYGGEGYDIGQGLALSSDGGVILTGDMLGRMSFGAGALVTPEGENGKDAFVAVLDADRNPVFLRHIGGVDVQSGQRAAVDGQGRVFIAGSVMGAVDLGLGMTPSSGYYETFLVALGP
ncbi:WD40 repeat domain-containing protein [Polyangium spumosum]|uniref:PQQ-binding-like beta-propeller repeat protein n=1 Tax=Polyangium spumosum TaxID=889282 RepID=A0A6N7PI87_9BACT|nr:WD40 repeat domain-containing protein [Polyangium spumosum]MRG91832.1 hypothetical protein [Polyangium spumosum]